jgi:hypothetical protein
VLAADSVAHPFRGSSLLVSQGSRLQHEQRATLYLVSLIVLSDNPFSIVTSSE